MARYFNELSATQLDAEIFDGIRAQIKRFGVDYLAGLGNISRTTIYKYASGQAINPSYEREIKRVLKRAVAMKEESDKNELEEAKSLMLV